MKNTDFLCCVDCKGKLKFVRDKVNCFKCKKSFQIDKGVFDFNRTDDELVGKYQKFQSQQDPYNFHSSSQIIISGHNRKMKILTKMFSKFDLKNKVVLDVGSGEGFPRFLKDCGVGIVQDISKNALLRSRQKLNSDKFVFIASNQDLPIVSDSVDVVFAGEIIEHVSDLDYFLNEIFRVLKKNGRFVLTTPNSKAIIFRLFGLRYAKDTQHISLQGYKSLIMILRKKFKIKKIYGFNQSFFHYIDRLMGNKTICDFWAKRFLFKPKYATGLIVECEK